MLRGRKAVRAQSAILHEKNLKPLLSLSHNRDFGTDALFIRTKITVGARSAQCLLLARDSSQNAVDI
jgi:hypothetical protein